MERVVVEASIEGLGRELEERPLEFFKESDLQARLYQLIREELTDKGKLGVEPPVETWEKQGVHMSGIDGNDSEYEVWLKDKIQNKAESRRKSHLTRVHTEFWSATDFGSAHENRVDVVVLRRGDERPYRPVSWNNGKQTLSFEMVEAAVEIKYLRDLRSFESRIEEVDPASVSVEELVEHVNLDFKDVRRDLERLENLANAREGGYSHLDSYFVLGSNYDPLYRGEAAKRRRKKPHINEKIGEAVRRKLRREYESVGVFYFHPAGAEWLSDPLTNGV